MHLSYLNLLNMMVTLPMMMVGDAGRKVLSGRVESAVRDPQCAGIALQEELSATTDCRADQAVQLCHAVGCQRLRSCLRYISRPITNSADFADYCYYPLPFHPLSRKYASNFRQEHSASVHPPR